MGFRLERPPVSQSLVTTWNECHRKAFWRYALGLVRAGVLTPEALFLGILVHAAMKILAGGGTQDAVVRQLHFMCEEELERATTAEGVMPVGADESVGRAKAKAIAMAMAFNELLSDRFQKGNVKILAAEHEVRAVLPSSEIGVRGKRDLEIVGQIDLLTEEGDNREKVISDHKTTSQPPAARAKTAAFEVQPILYRWLVSSLKDGDPPGKFRNYVLLKPTIRLKQTEDFDEYLVRVRQWYRDKAMTAPNDPPMVASTLTYGEMYPKEVVRQVVDVWRAFNQPLHAQRFPRTGAPYQCWKQGRFCPYVDLCFSDPALWPDQIALNFRQEFRYDGTVAQPSEHEAAR